MIVRLFSKSSEKGPLSYGQNAAFGMFQHTIHGGSTPRTNVLYEPVNPILPGFSGRS
jgi:hypothetical protein